MDALTLSSKEIKRLVGPAPVNVWPHSDLPDDLKNIVLNGDDVDWLIFVEEKLFKFHGETETWLRAMIAESTYQFHVNKKYVLLVKSH